MIDVVLAGAGEATRLPAPGRGVVDLAAEACADALNDSGFEQTDIDGIVTGYSLVEDHVDLSSVLSESLGLRPRWSRTVSRSGATGAALIVDAATAVLRGDCSTVLAVWADNRASTTEAQTPRALAAQMNPFEAGCGPLVATQYALVAQHALQTGHVDEIALASVAVQFRRHAAANPVAKHRDIITVDDVLASPLISSPLHLLECALVTDYGGAVVVTTRDRRPRPDEVLLRGFGEAASHYSLLRSPHLLGPGHQSAAAESGARAFTMAGLRPGDIRMAQLYDCFTITVLLLLEDLGFCAPRTAGLRVPEGMLARDRGSLPTNTNGGMLSCASGGILHVTEGVRQMRGTAGPHQLAEIPETAVVHGNGGVLGSQTTLVLGR